MGHIGPIEGQWESFLEKADPNAKVTMLNLLMFAETADYSQHPDESPCSGEEAYQRYSKLALACIESVGAKVLLYGKTAETVIGPVEERWDKALVVEYPSLLAFQEMISSEEYQSILHHRNAALKDSRLIPIFSS